MLSIVIFLARLINKDPYRMATSQDIEAYLKSNNLGVLYDHDNVFNVITQSLYLLFCRRS